MIWASSFLRRLVQRATLWGALILIALAALRLAAHQGRKEATAAFATRAAEARTRALRTAQKVHHDIETLPDAERRRRLARWMRD